MDSSESLYIYQYEYADSSYVIFMMILWLYISPVNIKLIGLLLWNIIF